MKIAFVIPFKYNWNSYPTTRATYEYLQILGHEVELFNKHENPEINYNKYDQVWLIGAGTKITEKEFKKIKIPVIAFGLSDPNLYSEEHMENCDIYFTNDWKLYNDLKNKKMIGYNPTSCDKRYHKNLELDKTTDILVHGVGKHKFVTNRNEIVNKLRKQGFSIKVFGRGWDKHEDTYGFIEDRQLIEEINKAKILLDITNETTALGHRVFEGSACGIPVLTIWREDLIELFIPYQEVITYRNFDDMLINLDYYLTDEDELSRIGYKAQKRCYKDHDISIRIQELLKMIKEIEL
jgi:glycosyltransferase involved in cell wall biosynthesis